MFRVFRRNRVYKNFFSICGSKMSDKIKIIFTQSKLSILLFKITLVNIKSHNERNKVIITI